MPTHIATPDQQSYSPIAQTDVIRILNCLSPSIQSSQPRETPYRKTPRRSNSLAHNGHASKTENITSGKVSPRRNTRYRSVSLPSSLSQPERHFLQQLFQSAMRRSLPNSDPSRSSNGRQKARTARHQWQEPSVNSGLCSQPMTHSLSQPPPSRTSHKPGGTSLVPFYIHDQPPHQFIRSEYNIRQCLILQPPVTLETLSELDLQRIIENFKLRHDICFDNDLHFRPNVFGKRGKEKLKSADEYWKSLKQAFLIYCDPRAPEADLRDAQTHIKAAFETVREIIKSLVPKRDHDIIAASFDVDLIMQQLAKKQYDFVRFATWLAHLLKTHCAPMRDDLVDNIAAHADEDELSNLISGFRALFGVLEVMKLDIANHQIRSLRHPLTEDTIGFEQRYYRNKIDCDSEIAQEAQRWFQSFRPVFVDIPAENLKLAKRNIFIHGFVSSLFLPASKDLPASLFEFDLSRIEDVRLEACEIIRTTICNAFFSRELPTDTHRHADQNLQFVRRLVRLGSGVGSETKELKHIANMMALEISRRKTGSFGPQYVESLSNEIAKAIQNGSHAFDIQLSNTRGQLAKLVSSYFEDYSGIALGAIVDSWTSKKEKLQKLGVPPLALSLHDLARRIAHIALLHWQVWAPLVYLDSS